MTIHVVHGASSTGKTTVGRALQTALGDSCVYVSIDALWPSLHAELAVGAKVFVDLTDVLFGQAAHWSRLGYDVVVDTVFESADCVTLYTQHVAGHAVLLVALRCAVDILERRETTRGDRRPGVARDQATRVYAYAGSDLELDTGALTPDACVTAILAVGSKRARAPCRTTLTS